VRDEIPDVIDVSTEAQLQGAVADGGPVVTPTGGATAAAIIYIRRYAGGSVELDEEGLEGGCQCIVRRRTSRRSGRPKLELLR
jgi:hypothetical protein